MRFMVRGIQHGLSFGGIGSRRTFNAHAFLWNTCLLLLSTAGNITVYRLGGFKIFYLRLSNRARQLELNRQSSHSADYT